jgi:hypothetical protein
MELNIIKWNKWVTEKQIQLGITYVKHEKVEIECWLLEAGKRERGKGWAIVTSYS